MANGNLPSFYPKQSYCASLAFVCLCVLLLIFAAIIFRLEAIAEDEELNVIEALSLSGRTFISSLAYTMWLGIWTLILTLGFLVIASIILFPLTLLC